MLICQLPIVFDMNEYRNNSSIESHVHDITRRTRTSVQKDYQWISHNCKLLFVHIIFTSFSCTAFFCSLLRCILSLPFHLIHFCFRSSILWTGVWTFSTQRFFVDISQQYLYCINRHMLTPREKQLNGGKKRTDWKKEIWKYRRVF